MKVLYLDCSMGIAGDMFQAALYELLTKEQKIVFLAQMNSLIKGVEVKAETVSRCGIFGTHMAVTVDGSEEMEHGQGADGAHCHDSHEMHSHDSHEMHSHDSHEMHSHDSHEMHSHDGHEMHSHDGHGNHAHHHAGMHEISHMIGDMKLPEKVKEQALAVYQKIAEAESIAHRRPVSEIHFHEVGTKDAVIDVVGTCLLMHELSVDQVICSCIHTGFGDVHCAHGILPVPAPATATLLLGVPTAAGEIEGELCTPTGAALVTFFADSYGTAPAMRTTAIGYGMGTKEFAQANCVRAMLGELETADEELVELSCNLDDMTAEDVGYVMENLIASGARDVFTVPVTMKKSRPGILLVCICDRKDAQRFSNQILLETTTLGVRRISCARDRLERKLVTMDTKYGPVRFKVASLPNGSKRVKPEYDDLAKIAGETGRPLSEIRQEMMKLWYHGGH